LKFRLALFPIGHDGRCAYFEVPRRRQAAISPLTNCGHHVPAWQRFRADEQRSVHLSTPVIVGAKTLSPRLSNKSETRRHIHPPPQAPCTSRKVFRAVCVRFDWRGIRNATKSGRHNVRLVVIVPPPKLRRPAHKQYAKKDRDYWPILRDLPTSASALYGLGDQHTPRVPKAPGKIDPRSCWHQEAHLDD
jgi:hypothetical protein